MRSQIILSILLDESPKMNINGMVVDEEGIGAIMDEAHLMDVMSTLGALANRIKEDEKEAVGIDDAKPKP